MVKVKVSKQEYVGSLAEKCKEEVMFRVRTELKSLGVTGEEYEDGCSNALDSRLSDLEDLISLQGFTYLEVK